jgi:hypothetical protein
MSGMRVPVPVWFAAVAFTVLLLDPQIGSSAPRTTAIPVAPCHSGASATNDLTYWQAYRTVSRHWTSAKTESGNAAGVNALPVLR